MLLIDKISSHEELIELHKQFSSLITEDLSLPMKQRKLDEKFAKFIGVSDWNTAVAKSKEPTDEQKMIQHLQAMLESQSNLLSQTSILMNKVLQDERMRSNLTQANKDLLNVLLGNLSTDIELIETPCKRCGCELDKQGFCTDDGCMYSDYKQDAPFTENEDGYKFHVPSRKRVTATVWTDDHVREVEFDASDYFHDAIQKNTIDDTLLKLSNCFFRGDYAADAIAEHFVSGGLGYGQNCVKELFEYHSEINSNRGPSEDPMGFECAVEHEELADWLKQEHPCVWERVKYLDWG